MFFILLIVNVDLWKINKISYNIISYIIDISQENQSSQVGNINDNSNNNFRESKGKATSDTNPDHNENKR